MKTIAILYNNRENRKIIEYLNNILLDIFGSYIKIQSYFADELQKEEKIYADTYLLVHEDMMFKLKNNIGNYSKVVTLKRSIRKKVLPKLMEIPNNSDVVVVNDTYDTEIETIYMLCELGINNLNYIPYNSEEHKLPLEEKIKYVITPNELALVPGNAEKIINIGFREISFGTLFSLKRILELDNDTIDRNIFRYSTELIDESTYYRENYYEGCLRNSLLNRVVDQSILGTVMLDSSWNTVYYNQEAEKIFELKKEETFDGIDAAVLRNEEEYRDYPLKINDESYLFEKRKVRLVDETIGYILTFQNEKTLRDIEATLKSTIAKKGLVAKYKFEDIVYESDSMRNCINIAKEVAPTDNTILIRGESGTGKELLAQSIHNFSSCSRGPFVAVNCAAIPESLIESELFGYEKGSFTGAQKNGKIGYFEQANGGTLFLDEIGNISHNFQTILLRAIQERQIIRIGSDKVVDVNVRIIAATNAELEKEVQAGNFRDDLFYRLNVIPINIDSLKNRREDILPLAKRFLGHTYNNLDIAEKNYLKNYDWPGNIRELQNATTYYKTLGEFPEYLKKFSGRTEERKTTGEIKIKADFETLLLSIIDEETQPFHGIGRNSILNRLYSEGIDISDGKLREKLHELQERELVIVCPGRTGTRITEKGKEYLNTKNK